MTEHPVAQEIDYIHVGDRSVEYPSGIVTESEFYRVGYDGVTRIEACTKSGMHADIPYVRVWRGDVAIAEFCQHSIVGVYFKGAA